MIGAKPFHIRFDKLNGFISYSDGTKYQILFDIEKYDAIYDAIRCLIELKSSVTYV